MDKDTLPPLIFFIFVMLSVFVLYHQAINDGTMEILREKYENSSSSINFLKTVYFR